MLVLSAILKRPRCLTAGDMLLVHAGEGRVEKHAEELYTSTLTLSSVVEDNSGLYVCLATNTAGGFNYKTAELTVTQPAKAGEKHPSLVMYIVIGRLIYL